MSDSNVVPLSEVISQIVDFSKKNGNELESVWNKVVCKIGRTNENDSENPCIGDRISANTHIVDLKNGVLLVEANHSGWIQYLRMYQKFILNGLKWNLPSLKITNLAFRVSGTEISLSDEYDNHLRNAQQKMNEKIENQEKELSSKLKLSEKEDGKEKLPAELLEKLEKLKNSMLTN